MSGHWPGRKRSRRTVEADAVEVVAAGAGVGAEALFACSACSAAAWISGVLRRLALSPDARAAPAARAPLRGVADFVATAFFPVFLEVLFVARALFAPSEVLVVDAAPAVASVSLLAAISRSSPQPRRD